MIGPVRKFWTVAATLTFIISLTACGGDDGGGAPPPQTGDSTPPTVSATNPANGATNVAVNVALTVAFSEQMNPATIAIATFAVKDAANNPVIGTVGYSGTSTTFTPSGNLASLTSYTATIATGVTDLAGNHLISAYSWSFTTGTAPDTTPPTVIATTPANGATGVATNTTVTATFSEVMDATTITATTFTVKDAKGNPVTGTVSYVGAQATFTPPTTLAISTAYTAAITTGVKDLGGNALTGDYPWTFTTTGTNVFAIRLGPLPHSVYTFNTSSPNNLTLLGSGTIPFSNYALGFDATGDTLYAMEPGGRLGTIDKSTGAYTLLGRVSGILSNHNVLGLATDPTTDTIYIVSDNGFTGVAALYTLNPNTLSATLIGTQSVAKNLVELAFDLSGNLYSMSLDTDSLYKINKLDAQPTLIGALGQDIISQQGMVFDQSTGVLYGIIGGNVAYAFGTINMATGAFTAIVTTGDVRKMAIEPMP
ncbi:MAG: Ig-like domain-containing protein [Nitrospira sp.]